MDPGALYVVLAIGLIAVVGFGGCFSPSNKLERELRAASRYALAELPEETRAADAAPHDELAPVPAARQRQSGYDRVACDCVRDCDSWCDRATMVHAM